MSPTAAFVGAAVIEGAAGTLWQTFAVVAFGANVATHCAVVKGWPIARGAVSVTADTLVLLLAGKVAIGTVVNTCHPKEEVVLLTLWSRRTKGNQSQ